MNFLKSRKIKLAQYVFGFFLLIFLIILFFRFADLKNLVFTLSQGIWYYIIIFFILQILYLLSQPLIFTNLYKIFSKIGNFWQLANVFLATNFVNLALPLAGLSGILTFVGYAKKNGLTRTQALIINTIFYVLVFFSFVFVIPLIFFFPGELKIINAWERNIILIFCTVIVALTVIFYAAITNKIFLDKLVRWLTGSSNAIYRFFVKKELVTKQKMARILDEFYLLRSTLKSKINLLTSPFLYALLGHILHVLVLYFIFLAFSIHAPIIVAIIGYIISVVFILVSITPSGVGIVEPLMILFFASSGISLEVATLVTFVFRGVVFWIPFILGFFSLRYIHFYEKRPN
jgi:hypothetical protein